MPSTVASIRELLFATGGPWCAWTSAWALIDDSLETSAGSTTTCSTGTFDSLRSRPTRSRRTQEEPFCSGKVETRIESMRSSRTACIAAVNGSGWATCPCASIPSDRSRASALRRRSSASGCEPRSGSLWGQTIRNAVRGFERARSRIRASSGSPSTVSFATTSTFSAPVRVATSETTCSTGIAPAALRISSSRLRRRQPDLSSGCVETTSSVGRSVAIASLTAVSGSLATTWPSAEMPASRSLASVRSSRRPADARRVFS